MFSQFSTVVMMQHSVQWSSPSPPCGRKQGQARWWGRRGANVEVYAFAGHVQYVVAVAALRKNDVWCGGEGGHGENVEAVAVAESPAEGRGERVVVVTALRKNDVGRGGEGGRLMYRMRYISETQVQL